MLDLALLNSVTAGSNSVLTPVTSHIVGDSNRVKGRSASPSRTLSAGTFGATPPTRDRDSLHDVINGHRQSDDRLSPVAKRLLTAVQAESLHAAVSEVSVIIRYNSWCRYIHTTAVVIAGNC